MDDVSSSWCDIVGGVFDDSTCQERVDSGESDCSLDVPTFECAACCRCVNGQFECDNLPEFVCDLLNGMYLSLIHI